MWWKVFETTGKSLLWMLLFPFRFLAMLFGGGRQVDPVQDYQERTAYAEDREADREAAVLEAQADARRATLARILAEAQSPEGLEKPVGMEIEPEPEDDEEDEEEQMEMERWVAASPAR